MPRKSKRMAAKQAALSRKKKASRTSVYRAPEAPSKTAPTERAAPAPRPAPAPVPDESLPEFAVPQEAEAPAPRPVAQAAPVTGRRGAPLRMPYLRSDLRATARVGAVLVAALIVLAFVL